MLRPLLPLLLLGVSGCFAYTPVSLDTVQPGENVRVRITPEQAQEIDALLMRETRILDGVLLERGPSFLVEVPVATQLQGGARQSLNQRILLPREGIVEMELKSLDRVRTGLLLGGAGALVIGTVIFTLTKELGGDTRTDPPAPPELRAPRFPPFTSVGHP